MPKHLRDLSSGVREGSTLTSLSNSFSCDLGKAPCSSEVHIGTMVLPLLDQ